MNKIPADQPFTTAGAFNQWLTNDTESLLEWHGHLAKHKGPKKYKKKVKAVIQEFRELLYKDTVVRMYVAKMIDQIPVRHKNHRIKNSEDLLQLLEAVLTRAPEYNKSALVGCPMSAIVVWTMGNPAGFAAYRNEKINKMFQKLLFVWAEFLNSADSLYVLNSTDKGWMCCDARDKLKMSNYRYKEDAEHWGFKSWNDFFSRKLAPKARPIEAPKDDKIITSACDSTVHRITHNIEKFKHFWIKEQPYSLNDMLADDPDVDEFVGGSIFQAYLSPFNYHRWHSPVNGVIKKAYVRDGLYFSQDTAVGEDPTAQGYSEEYVAHVQTRAMIFIEADDPVIGLMCVMPVGMVEISSCLIDPKIKSGYRIKKGEELGTFQFGGSTHCLIFRHEVIKFTAKLDTFYEMGRAIAVAN